jgi:hypothetical protein
MGFFLGAKRVGSITRGDPIAGLNATAPLLEESQFGFDMNPGHSRLPVHITIRRGTMRGQPLWDVEILGLLHESD